MAELVVVCFTAVDPVKERVLVSFKESGVMDRFQVTTDQVLGGKTTAAFELKQIGNLAYGVCAIHVLLSCELTPVETRNAGSFHGVVIPPYYGDRPNRGGFASFRTKVRKCLVWCVRALVFTPCPPPCPPPPLPALRAKVGLGSL